MLFFVLDVAHGDLFLHKLSQKTVIFRGFSKFFSELLELLILIETSNIFRWKPAKEVKVDVVLGQNLGQIRSNVAKKN